MSAQAKLKDRPARAALTLFRTLGTVAFAAILGSCSAGDREPQPRERFEQLRAKLDATYPGRGVADYPGNPVVDVPKAYAAILKAEVLAGEEPRISQLGQTAGNFLLAHSDERRDGFPGWGVPAAWDAYGDGSINPTHTKYAISDAVVLDALLDWAEFDETAPRDRIYALTKAVLKPFADPDVLTPAGLLPYSLELADRKYDTFNPAAYLAGVMQRYSRLEKDEMFAASLRKAADKTVSALLANKLTTPDGAWYWHYSISEPVTNDLAHAGYIIHGLRLYADNGGVLSSSLDMPAIEKHLADFSGGSGQLRGWPTLQTDITDPARAYDLGMGLYLACSSKSRPLREMYLKAIAPYVAEDGHYMKYPVKSAMKNALIMEYEAYVYMGLAACAGGQ